MAKGLRSKSKRSLRTQRRQNLVKTPRQIEREQKTMEALQAVVQAPKPVPASEEGAEDKDEDMMATDPNLPELTTKNPAKLAKKLRARRLAASKPMKKKMKPLAGANQFHKKNKKRR